jgi:hypothetical protein
VKGPSRRSVCRFFSFLVRIRDGVGERSKFGTKNNIRAISRAIQDKDRIYRNGNIRPLVKISHHPCQERFSVRDSRRSTHLPIIVHGFCNLPVLARPELLSKVVPSNTDGVKLRDFQSLSRIVCNTCYTTCTSWMTSSCPVLLCPRQTTPLALVVAEKPYSTC